MGARRRRCLRCPGKGPWAARARRGCWLRVSWGAARWASARQQGVQTWDGVGLPAREWTLPRAMGPVLEVGGCPTRRSCLDSNAAAAGRRESAPIARCIGSAEGGRRDVGRGAVEALAFRRRSSPEAMSQGQSRRVRTRQPPVTRAVRAIALLQTGDSRCTLEEVR